MLLILAGCTRSSIVSYELRFSNPSLAPELSQAALRVVQGRLYALKQDAAAKTATMNASGSLLSILLDTNNAATLTKQLTSPLNFSIMTQAPANQAEMTVEKIGGLRGSGITEKHVERAILNPPDASGKSSVTVVFTPEGTALWKSLCKQNLGKILAVTVRHHLVSTLTVGPNDEKSNSVQVSGAPDAAIAQAFADDVNVGSHVTFLPRSQNAQP